MNIQILKTTMLFRCMEDDEIHTALIELDAHQKSYPKGETILRAGSTIRNIGLILVGSVTIESNDVWGNCTILSHVGPGQFFAETYALLPNEVMLVDVKANADSIIMFVYAGHIFDDISLETWKAKLLKNLLRISAQKNLTLSGRSFHTSPKSARGRLLSYLNTVSLQMHSTEFDIPFDRQQLADYLNLERTNMSKELTRMQNDGIIECRKSHFKLIKTKQS